MTKRSTKPVFEDIEKILREEISSGHYEPHQKFLSEVKLTERFKVNAATARKAVDRLVMDGLLYKVRTNGTFIAPRRKNKMILIVIPAHGYSLISHCSIEAFMDSPYRFQEVQADEYLKHVADIKLIYPELSGILFYRDKPVVSHTFGQLEEQNIPFIVYGSSTLKPLLKNKASLLYSERAIVTAAMDHLREQGCKRIGIVYDSSWPADLERYRQYLIWFKTHATAPDPDLFFDDALLSADTKKERFAKYTESLDKGLMKQADGFFTTGDDTSALMVQAAIAAGIKIPDNVKIMGVNNHPICEIIQPQMSSVELPVDEDAYRSAAALIDIIEGKKELPKLRSNIKVIQRETT